MENPDGLGRRKLQSERDIVRNESWPTASATPPKRRDAGRDQTMMPGIVVTLRGTLVTTPTAHRRSQSGDGWYTDSYHKLFVR